MLILFRIVTKIFREDGIYCVTETKVIQSKNMDLIMHGQDSHFFIEVCE